MSTSTGAYPATLAEAHDEIRELRLALLHAHGRIQTVEVWSAELADQARYRYVEAQRRLRRVERAGLGDDLDNPERLLHLS